MKLAESVNGNGVVNAVMLVVVSGIFTVVEITDFDHC